MRHLDNITKREVYRDDSEIELAIILGKGNIVENQTITQSVAQFMIEGESRIDFINNFPVTKINGKVHKLIIDDDSNIIYQEI